MVQGAGPGSSWHRADIRPRSPSCCAGVEDGAVGAARRADPVISGGRTQTGKRGKRDYPHCTRRKGSNKVRDTMDVHALTALTACTLAANARTMCGMCGMCGTPPGAPAGRQRDQVSVTAILTSQENQNLNATKIP